VTAEAAMLIALLLGRPAGLVSTVYAMGGLDAVAVCEYESQFNPRAWRREREGAGLMRWRWWLTKRKKGDRLFMLVETERRGCGERAFRVLGRGRAVATIAA
jgi:hypothetical protein